MSISIVNCFYLCTVLTFQLMFNCIHYDLYFCVCFMLHFVPFRAVSVFTTCSFIPFGVCDRILCSVPFCSLRFRSTPLRSIMYVLCSISGRFAPFQCLPNAVSFPFVFVNVFYVLFSFVLCSFCSDLFRMVP